MNLSEWKNTNDIKYELNQMSNNNDIIYELIGMEKY